MSKTGRFIPRNTTQEDFFKLYGNEQIKIVGSDFIYSVRVEDLFRIFRDRLVIERTFLGVEAQ